MTLAVSLKVVEISAVERPRGLVVVAVTRNGVVALAVSLSVTVRLADSGTTRTTHDRGPVPGPMSTCWGGTFCGLLPDPPPEALTSATTTATAPSAART